VAQKASTTERNSDLVVGAGDRPTWNQPDRRRRAFHNMHGVFRYSLGIRAPEVLRLGKVVDRRIGDLPSVRRLTGTTYFSGMVVVRGGDVLFESYARDFGPDQPHSVQSITKTTMNLVIGLLVERGMVDLGRAVSHYVPDVGSGYATATVQDVLDMNVINDYSEDYRDPLRRRRDGGGGTAAPRRGEFTTSEYAAGSERGRRQPVGVGRQVGRRL
jgi:hypothetical protein